MIISLLIAALLAVPKDPSILTVPVVMAAELSPQDQWIKRLHVCENPDDIPKVLDTNKRYSYGKYQWQMASWLNYKSLGATKENILDETMQDTVTRYVLDHGGQGNWYHCSQKLGPYPLEVNNI